MRMTTMKRSTMLSLGISALALLSSLVVWSAVPSPMPIHWDAAGNPNGWATRAVGLTMLPLSGAFVAGILAAFARTMADKPKAQSVMGKVMVASTAFMGALHLMVIRAALTTGSLSVGVLMLLMGLLLTGLGLMMGDIEQNQWVGVRTPWTLADETNWALTHRFARWTMSIGGLVAVLAGLVLSGTAAFGVGFAAVMIGSLLPIFASYVIHASRE
jgi:immunity protein, SdpI family